MPEPSPSAAPRYAPFCRTWDTHGPLPHDARLRCDCPCHGGTAPWWIDNKIAKEADRDRQVFDTSE